jgi:glycosyltransferase involved in cell wall biosynthesis
MKDLSLQSAVHCEIDSFNDGTITGWACNRLAPGEPAHFYVLVDGQQVAEVVCDRSRPDVAASGIAAEIVGYSVRLPLNLLDGQSHRIEFRDLRRMHMVIQSRGSVGEAFDFTYKWRPIVHSYVDGLRGNGLEGWVLRSNYLSDTLDGNCIVRVACEGITVGHVRANQMRNDVGKAFSGSTYCGFRFIPPETSRRGLKQTYQFYLMPENEELNQSPLNITLISDVAEAQIAEISHEINQMHVRLTRLRRNLLDLLPSKSYTLSDYPEWYGEYARALKARVIAAREIEAPAPLVSVICPVYQPKLNEFCAAVDSVIAQTYQNWELILVDDGSMDPVLTKQIAAYADADPRIKARPMAKNGGISRSTNHGLANATGDWIAFFDHDDLIADVALEVMVNAATATGAKLLYSDEDKVDAFNNHTAPAFKPDWNHRLMLGVNYVCHLLIVARSALNAAGPLNSKYDGAQDHALILRLAEHVPFDKIVHVPEVLYHWRITDNSTASDVSAKPYALKAGIACVEDHLERIGRPARVTNIRDSTLYHQDWLINWEPSVEIIIPFKDEVETTSRCLRAVLTKTAYQNFRVILVDNWSTSEAAAAFCAEMAKLPNIRVLRIEEPFNYSRLNNLAAAGSTADFLVMMNNDLFVGDERWLRVCVNEALSDPAVALVGGKFLYPSRTVQHAGVVTGIGGVAGHVGVGLAEDDHGYGGRLLFAQEYSGVTGAAVLVRNSVFVELGGLDETHLKVAFNDVDFCLRVRAAGYKIIWTPDFVAEHHESLSRGDDERPAQEARFFHEAQTMRERWGESLNADPFYNKNFSLERAPYTELLAPDQAVAFDPVSAPGEPRRLVDPMQAADLGPVSERSESRLNTMDTESSVSPHPGRLAIEVRRSTEPVHKSSRTTNAPVGKQSRKDGSNS